MNYFHYRHTCPEIDEAMEDIFSSWEDFVAPICDADLRNHLTPLFDRFREINTDMRDEAESQMETLRDEAIELEQRVTDLEKELSEASR